MVESKIGSTFLTLSLLALFSFIAFRYDPLPEVEKSALLLMNLSDFSSPNKGVLAIGAAVDLTTFVDFRVGKLLELIIFFGGEPDVDLEKDVWVAFIGGENDRVLGALVAGLVVVCFRFRFGTSSFSSSLSCEKRNGYF